MSLAVALTNLRIDYADGVMEVHRDSSTTRWQTNEPQSRGLGGIGDCISVMLGY